MTNPIHHVSVEAEPLGWALRAVGDALEAAGIPFVVTGEIAHGTLGRPRPARAIELLVRPEHVDRALVALRSAGFRVDGSGHGPVFPADRDGIPVELRTEARGAITLDEEMLARARSRVYAGARVPVMSPEDLFVLAALTDGEGEGPSHWHAAVALLAHFDFDWRYLLRRARHGPRRVLSLILYAESEDRAVPREAVDHLVALLYGLSRHGEGNGDRLGLGASTSA